MPVVICQNWVESEAGWGTRPDGMTIHKNLADHAAFIKAYWDKQPKGPTPAEYSRPDGQPFEVELNAKDKIYSKLIKSKNGIWEHDYKITSSLPKLSKK